MPGDPSKFARFVTAMVFQLLNRSPKTKSEVQVTGIPPSPPLYDRIDSDLVYLSLDIMDHAPHILYCIHHIIENTSQSISLSIIVLTLKYIDRIINYQIKTPKAGSEAHLFCICLILAQKQLDDHAFKNKTWSRITLIPVDVITLMERECLACLKFDLYVSHTEFSLWHSNIQKLALGWNQGYLKKSRLVPSLKKYNEKKSSNSAFKRKRVSKGMMSLSTIIVAVAASVSVLWLWKRTKTEPATESPRGLSIQRASMRNIASRSFNDEQDTLVDEGPTILNALFMFAEDAAKLDAVIHRSITCNHCSISPVRGLRYKCANCPDFDLCAMCEALDIHERNHVFIKIKIPVPPLANLRTPVAPLFYPGSAIKSGSTTPVNWISLTQSSHFDILELEALFEQFRFLASVENISGESTLGITRSCFQKCLGPIGLEINLITDQVFKFFDRNNDLLITFDEFVRGMSVLCKGTFEERVQSAFNGYDLDGDGFISRAELKRMYKAYFHLSMELVRDVVKSMETELVENFDEFDSKPVSSSFNAPITSSGAPVIDTLAANEREDTRILPSPIKIQPVSFPTSPINLNTSPVLLNGKLVTHAEFPVMEAMGQSALEKMVSQTFLDASAEDKELMNYTEFYCAAEKDSNLLAWFEALGSVF